MFIFGKFDGLSVESEQADDPVEVDRRQAWVGVEGKGAFIWKADNAATRVIVVVMSLESALWWCGWFKLVMEIVVLTIINGVTVRFALGKRHGVNQEVVADFEEDADFCNCDIHKALT